MPEHVINMENVGPVYFLIMKKYPHAETFLKLGFLSLHWDLITTISSPPPAV